MSTNDEPTTPKLSRVEVEQLLERAKSVPAISFGYIRLAEDCLAYMDALSLASRHLDRIRSSPQGWVAHEYIGVTEMADEALREIARAVLPASESKND